MVSCSARSPRTLEPECKTWQGSRSAAEIEGAEISTDFNPMGAEHTGDRAPCSPEGLETIWRGVSKDVIQTIH